jgi:hypothetical protein
MASIAEHADTNISTVLVGTKSDLKDSVVIDRQEAEAFAKNNNMHYYATSSLKNAGINEMFQDFFNQIYENHY